MKLKSLVAISALMIAQSAFAADQQPVCPSVEAMQAAGVTTAIRDQQDGIWIAANPSNMLGTTNEWTFLMGPIDAQDQSSVVSTANGLISTLELAAGPLEGQQQGQYGCIYLNQTQDLIGITITPAIDLNDGVKMLKARRR